MTQERWSAIGPEGGRPSRTIHVVQGEHCISSESDVVLVTILGSCVAACLRDPSAGVGGMNHFLLPGDLEPAASAEAERQAVHAMELLVNALLAAGASRRRLEGKLFGGARTMKGFADIGAKNAEFAIGFLEREGISVVNTCLGGASGRRVQYWPVSGRARRSFMDKQPVVVDRPSVAPVSAAAGMLELF